MTFGRLMIVGSRSMSDCRRFVPAVRATVTFMSPMMNPGRSPDQSVRILVLPLHYRCNCRCVMCNVWERRETEQITVELLQSDGVSRYVLHDLEAVNVTGGEPVLHADFQRIVETIVTHAPGLNTLTLQTNGLETDSVATHLRFCIELLSREQARGRTIHLDVNISLDGPREVHDEVRGIKGAWTRATKSAAVARQLIAGLNYGAVAFNCTVVRQNVHHLGDTLRIASDLKVPVVFTLPQTTDIYMTNCRNRSAYVLSASERVVLLSFLRKIEECPSSEVAMSTRQVRMLMRLLKDDVRTEECPLFWNGLFLEPTGEAYPCWGSSLVLLGNVFHDEPGVVLGRRFEPAYLENLGALCSTCPSNCYFDWRRNMFARRIGLGV